MEEGNKENGLKEGIVKGMYPVGEYRIRQDSETGNPRLFHTGDYDWSSFGVGLGILPGSMGDWKRVKNNGIEYWCYEPNSPPNSSLISRIFCRLRRKAS